MKEHPKFAGFYKILFFSLLILMKNFPNTLFGKRIKYDYAVITLQTRVSFNRYVQPVCLPLIKNETRISPQDDFVNKIVTVSGWGLLWNKYDKEIINGENIHLKSPMTRYLMTAEFVVQPNSICEEFVGYDPKTMLCASENNWEKCLRPGDSGGKFIETAEVN